LHERGGNTPLAAVTRDRPWRFEFEASREHCDALCLHLLDDPASRERTVSVLWRSIGATMAGGIQAKLSKLRRLPDGHLELVVEWQRPESPGRAYAIEVSSPDATDDAPIRIARGGKGKGYRPRAGSDPKEPGPALDLGYSRREFAHVAVVGEHALWRFAPSRGRAWVVGRATGAANADEAFELVTADDFDPYASVVLEGGASSGDASAPTSTAEPLAETPISQRWRASSSLGGWLVLAQTWFPGWRARVDGVETPLLRANYAFGAVALPAGEHEVELSYEPASFRTGAIVSLASALIGVAAFVLAKRATLRGP
jgi:hypothetical protein